MTALMYACSSGIKHICNLLMSQEGVNITERDNNDLDALFHACGGCDDVDLIKTLIKLGCDPLREIQEGWTCLHTASLKGNHEVKIALFIFCFCFFRSLKAGSRIAFT